MQIRVQQGQLLQKQGKSSGISGDGAEINRNKSPKKRGGSPRKQTMRELSAEGRHLQQQSAGRSPDAKSQARVENDRNRSRHEEIYQANELESQRVASGKVLGQKPSDREAQAEQELDSMKDAEERQQNAQDTRTGQSERMWEADQRRSRLGSYHQAAGVPVSLPSHHDAQFVDGAHDVVIH